MSLGHNKRTYGVGPSLYKSGPSGLSLAQTMAIAHASRVAADSGILPAGANGLASILQSVITAYGVTSSADFNTKVPVFLDPQYTGYKLGAGAGTTAGQAARTVYAISSSADVTQTTAASQPLLLAWSGVNYWWGSGVAGNYCSTPDNVANEIVDSFDIAVYASAFDWSQSYGMLQSKFTTGVNGNYYFCTMSGKYLQYAYSNGVTVPALTTTIKTPFANNTGGWLKVSHNTTTGNVSIYYSNDVPTTTYNSISWTLLESIASVLGPRNNYNCPIEIGSNSGGQNPFLGKIYRATISDTIGGAPVVDFNPSEYSAASSQTDWNSSTGEVWSINVDSTTGTGYRGALVNRTICMSDGIDDSLITNITISTLKTVYSAYKIWNISATGSLLASNNGAEIIDANLNGSGSVYQYDNLTNNISISLSGTANKITIRTFVCNGVSSLQQINNGTEANGTLSTQVATSLKLFQERNGSLKSKMIYNTFILTSTTDISTIRTSMYNVLKTMNLL